VREDVNFSRVWERTSGSRQRGGVCVETLAQAQVGEGVTAGASRRERAAADVVGGIADDVGCYGGGRPGLKATGREGGAAGVRRLENMRLDADS
jgi:hypothetical protein